MSATNNPSARAAKAYRRKNDYLTLAPLADREGSESMGCSMAGLDRLDGSL